MTFWKKLWYKWTGREEIAEMRVKCTVLQRQVGYLKERDKSPTEADFQALQWKKFLQNKLGKATYEARVEIQRAFADCSAIPPPSEKKTLETVWPVVATITGFEFEALLMGVRLLGIKEKERKEKMAVASVGSTMELAQDRRWLRQDRRDFGPREEF